MNNAISAMIEMEKRMTKDDLTQTAYDLFTAYMAESEEDFAGFDYTRAVASFKRNLIKYDRAVKKGLGWVDSKIRGDGGPQKTLPESEVELRILAQQVANKYGDLEGWDGEQKNIMNSIAINNEYAKKDGRPRVDAFEPESVSKARWNALKAATIQAGKTHISIAANLDFSQYCAQHFDYDFSKTADDYIDGMMTSFCATLEHMEEKCSPLCELIPKLFYERLRFMKFVHEKFDIKAFLTENKEMYEAMLKQNYARSRSASQAIAAEYVARLEADRVKDMIQF